MNIVEIIPGKLYQSAEFKKNLTTADKVSILDGYNIDVVINVYKNKDTELSKILNAYLYHPLADGKYIDGTIMIVADRAASLIKQGHVVLTHCHAGRNRSGFVNALIAMRVLRLSGEEALNLVRERRPRAIDNESFERYLRLS